MFYGSRSCVEPYFAAPPLCMHAPEHSNPADWLLDNSCLDYRSTQSEKETVKRNERIIEQFRAMQKMGKMIDGNDDPNTFQQNSSDGTEKMSTDTHSNGQVSRASSLDAAHNGTALNVSGQLPKVKKLNAQRSRSSSFMLQDGGQGEIVPLSRAPFGLAFAVLLQRSWLNFRRQPLLISSRVGQVLAFAVILTLYYARLGDNQAAVNNRLGLVQEFTAVIFIGMLNCMAIYPSERDVFYREYSDRSYRTLPFLLAYSVGEVSFLAEKNTWLRIRQPVFPRFAPQVSHLIALPVLPSLSSRVSGRFRNLRCSHFHRPDAVRHRYEHFARCIHFLPPSIRRILYHQ